MIIVDAHEDIGFNALVGGRDYLKNALEKRRAEAGTPAAEREGLASIGLPDAILGRVAIVFGTLFVEPNRKTAISPEPFSTGFLYNTPHEAYQVALKQADYYQLLYDTTPRIRPIRTIAELDGVLATWADGTTLEDHQQGVVLLIENGDSIIEPKQFEEWYERGVRVVGPAWCGTRYCGGTGELYGLTDVGRELLEVLGGFNTLLDLSHMPEESFFEALDRYGGQMIASHSNPRYMLNHQDERQRLLSDAQIRRLAERDGVMGVVPYNRFLSFDWRKTEPRLPFSRLLEAIDYICQLTGSAAHVGIGTDMDGGFGAESLPETIDTVTDLWTIGDGLRERGYDDGDIDAILSGNFLRKLRQTLPER
jgi:membrane dipeptidase